MKFKEELEALRESEEIVEIADKTRGTLVGGIIKEVEEDFIEYIGIVKVYGIGTDEYGYPLSPSGSILIEDTEPLKSIKTLIANISVKEISEKEKRRIRNYLYEAEKKEKKKKEKEG